jgi:hypothetical protein
MAREKFNMYDRVTELLRESGHLDPENATEMERFQCAMSKVLGFKKSPDKDEVKG